MQEKRIVVEVSNPYLDARAKDLRDTRDLVLIFITCMVTGSVVYWLYNLITHWQTTSAPYKYALAFYYYSIFVPVRSFGHVWEWMSHLDLTPYPNLNGIMAMAGMAIYSFFMVFVFLPLVIGSILKRLKLSWGGALALLLAPGFLAAVWYVVAHVFGWLFARG